MKIRFIDASDNAKKYNVGDKVNVFVVDVNVDKEKVAFSVKEFKKVQARKEISQYMSSSDNDDGAYTLGDMLNDQKNN
jgi:small subunit ribosomal protein S1